jgi:aminoglycoside phosphotransferase family enzyme
MSTIIDDLQNPESFPDKTKSIRVVQTHISAVFVGDEFVYKIKKPVDFGFLDFSTLEKRHYYCNQEVALNRRLSQDVYLGVLPIMFDGKTHTLKQRSGEAVEYAVKMRRIPDDQLMKSVFSKGELTDSHLEKIAKVLAGFHRRAAKSVEIDEFGKPESFKVNTDENFEQVEKYIGITISKGEFDAINQWTEKFFETNHGLFLKRVEEGRIRDCHGDLHMEHICFTENLSIIDCIEFNERFRYSDSIADIAFLLMDLEYHGDKSSSKILWDYYKEFAGEEKVDSLLTFYKIYRAFVRGKVNSFQLDDTSISPEKKEEAVQTASNYFKLAYSYGC